MESQWDEPLTSPSKSVVSTLPQELESTVGDNLAPLKRGRGRPKGSCNAAIPESMLTSSVPPKPKQPVERSKGSGPKQQAARDKSMLAVKKGRVGHPRKYPTFGMTKLPQKSMVRGWKLISFHKVNSSSSQQFSALLHTGLSY